jgi:hypothetical protein
MLILLFSLCLLLSVFTFSSSILAFFSVSSCRLLHIFFTSFGIYRGFHHPPVTLLLLFFARFCLYPFSRYPPASASLNTSAINISASLLRSLSLPFLLLLSLPVPLTSRSILHSRLTLLLCSPFLFLVFGFPLLSLQGILGLVWWSLCLRIGISDRDFADTCLLTVFFSLSLASFHC